MATPVGPVARDPNDPDGWDWEDPDDDHEPDAGTRYGMAVRLVALLIVVGFVLLVVVR